jgi:hypothetical protein
VVFVASDESSKAQHPSEEPLDVPPSSIAPQTSTILGLGLSPRVMRRDHLDPVAAQVIVQLVAVVGAIPDEFFGKVLYESRGERVVDELRFMPLTTRSPDGDRKTMTVCHRHDLGRFAASSDANFKTPLFAPAWVPSMNASVRSILPRSRRSLARAARMRSKTPSRSHFWKRSWHV